MSLCLDCGFCCDGTMFSNVPLGADEAVPHRAIGACPGDTGFAQPCAALNRTACTVYEGRPKACRAFRCGALAGLEDGTMSRQEAEGTLAEVRARRAQVAELVRASTPGAAVVAARQLVKEGRATAEITDALNRLLRLVMLLSQEPPR